MKYALVTGASSGIGRHISGELAKRGYSIMAVSNQSAQLDDLKSEIEKRYPVSVLTYSLDLAKPSAAKELFDYCESNALEIEVLVNNAGILVYGDVVSVDYVQAVNILQLHVNTPALLCRLFGEKMVQKRNGYILNVSSISAVMPFPVISLYGPTKTFLRAFTRALRSEMKPYNVKVTCLLPGATHTSLYDTRKINISLSMKLRIMKKADGVARSGVKALFAGKAEAVPGLLNKSVVLLFPLLPRFVIDMINRLRLRRNLKTS